MDINYSRTCCLSLGLKLRLKLPLRYLRLSPCHLSAMLVLILSFPCYLSLIAKIGSLEICFLRWSCFCYRPYPWLWFLVLTLVWHFLVICLVFDICACSRPWFVFVICFPLSLELDLILALVHYPLYLLSRCSIIFCFT